MVTVVLSSNVVASQVTRPVQQASKVTFRVGLLTVIPLVRILIAAIDWLTERREWTSHGILFSAAVPVRDWGVSWLSGRVRTERGGVGGVAHCTRY